MKNYIQPGDVITCIAPVGGVVSGRGYVIGEFFVIAAITADATEEFEGQLVGVFELAKTSAQAWTRGQRVFWDSANHRADTDSSVGPAIGAATEVAANPSSVGRVRLDGIARAGAEGGAGESGVTVENTPAPTVKTTAGNVTITAAEALSGVYARDPNGADRTDTLPTAALLVAAIAGAEVGDTVNLRVVNTADADEDVVIAAGAGGTLVGSGLVLQNQGRSFQIRLTNVTASAEAYSVYG